MTSRVVAPQGTTTTKSKRQPRVAFPWKRSLLPPTTFAGGARNHPMGIEDAVAMDDDGTLISPPNVEAGPTPYSLRLASSARKRPRTSEERFAISFSCDAVAMPATPLGPEDLPETYIMINVPQEVPGMSITGFSVEIVSDEAKDSASLELAKQAMFADPTKAGVVVEVALQTLDKVGRAVLNESPVTIATFGDRGLGGLMPHTTNASYDGSVGDIPISGGQHMMVYAFVRSPTSADAPSSTQADPSDVAKVIGNSKIVLHVIGHVILPPAEEGDEVGVSIRSTTTTTCPRREARKFINRVHQRSSTQASAAALATMRSVMVNGLRQGSPISTTTIAPAPETSSQAAPIKAPTSPKMSSSSTQQVAPSPTAAAAGGKAPLSAAEKARKILLKRREATADGTPSKAARKGLVPATGKKRQ